MDLEKCVNGINQIAMALDIDFEQTEEWLKQLQLYPSICPGIEEIFDEFENILSERMDQFSIYNNDIDYDSIVMTTT